VPKPKMPDGLYVSVSQVKTYLACPRKYELKYVRGEEPAFVPVALAFGSAFHEALAAYYWELKMTGEPLRRDLVIDVFRSAWDRASEGPAPLQGDDEDDTASVAEKGVSMLHAFYEHAGRAGPVDVDDVERGFAITLHDPVTGEPLEEQLVGTMDLVVRDEGHRVVVEHKTASRRFTEDQLRFDVQMSAYKVAAREDGLGDVALRYQVITQAKVPAVQIADVTRDAGDEQDFLAITANVLRAIDAGVSYPVRGWACRSCPYSAACRG
jgi:putative RecB family exonuclease